MTIQYQIVIKTDLCKLSNQILKLAINFKSKQDYFEESYFSLEKNARFWPQSTKQNDTFNYCLLQQWHSSIFIFHKWDKLMNEELKLNTGRTSIKNLT